MKVLYQALAFILLVCGFMVFAVVVVDLARKAKAQELIQLTDEEREDIKKWIPQTCCWTNDCCFKVRNESITPMPHKQYRVNITRQDKAFMGWSQLDMPVRCTCDYQHSTKQWVSTPMSDTRCLFPLPMGY